MPQDEVLAGFAEILGALTCIDRADITPEMSFADDLGMDSLTRTSVLDN